MVVAVKAEASLNMGKGRLDFLKDMEFSIQDIEIIFLCIFWQVFNYFSLLSSPEIFADTSNWLQSSSSRELPSRVWIREGNFSLLFKTFCLVS